ncbi:MAG TPA: MerR family transcriptional regulator [Candidatus Limnocylindrales bacterium]|nr:MerR family transcriptional regulator [Candidatus Limnocylindrales bacterium]
MFTVGAFASLSGVSAKALRAYDEIGLFKPAWVDPQNGYRLYSPAQLPEIRRIVALRSVGMGLADIAKLLSGGDDLRAALDRRRAELESERQQVEARLAALGIHVELAAAGDKPDVVIRPVAAQPIAALAMSLVPNGNVERAYYELEAYVRDAGRRAPRPPGLIASNGEDGAEIFVPLTGPIAPTERIRYRRLAAMRMATTLHHGSYATLPDTVGELEEWVRGAGLTIAGPLHILYLQFGAEPELRIPRGYVVEDSTDYLTEVQLPIGD